MLSGFFDLDSFKRPVYTGKYLIFFTVMTRNAHHLRPRSTLLTEKKTTENCSEISCGLFISPISRLLRGEYAKINFRHLSDDLNFFFFPNENSKWPTAVGFSTKRTSVKIKIPLNFYDSFIYTHTSIYVVHFSRYITNLCVCVCKNISYI